MYSKIKTDEINICDMYPDILNILLLDNTTKQNIFWATKNYQHLGIGYEYGSSILPELITGNNGNVILPRVKKNKDLQQSRIRDMAEVFTPSWICNAQNNLIDNAWFGRENLFNMEYTTPDGLQRWSVNLDKIIFPDGKTWMNYLKDIRLEITCGEAPYITSRYDTTTAEYIPINKRIGLLDRKLRVLNENTSTPAEWFEAAKTAYKNTYAFEWQGDSLLIARVNMLLTFIENYFHKFGNQPLLESLKYIAYIISWNVWQMDGLKGVVPGSCANKNSEAVSLFAQTDIILTLCEGCKTNNILKHNGSYCIIKDWGHINSNTGIIGKDIKFIDLIVTT